MLFINAEQQNYIIILSALLQIFFNEPFAQAAAPVQNAASAVSCTAEPSNSRQFS
jgi:hypothetical protein